jgi:predicted dehydrogenase
MRKVRWGVISTADIGLNKVLPAMQRGQYCDIVGIASRKLASAQEAASRLGIRKAYGSYEALLADPEIEAVYNPLPNHLHVPWSLKALEAGKHVLCEKPLALNAAQAQSLVDAARRHPELKLMEAFMYRFHPQWQRARRLVREGAIGALRTIHSFFSYYNVDSNNVRNQADIGGGGLYDIGCYNISLSRFMFEREPTRACGIIEYDPQFKTDRLASALLDFEEGTATFTCATQLTPYQRVNIYGTEGRVEIEIPFNAPPDRPCRLWHQSGDHLEEIVLETVDQYTLQGDAFSQAILNDTPVPTPIEDALANMRVIDAVFESAKRRTWVEVR